VRPRQRPTNVPIAELAAGGTLPRLAHESAPATSRRLWLIVEMGLLFIGMPLLMNYAVHELRIPLVLVLQPILLGLIFYLLVDPRFRLKTELARGFPWRHVAGILAVFAVAASAVTYYVATHQPSSFLGLLRYRPELWLLIACFYPLLSVIPQELVYRTYFFHRYGPLFGSQRWLAIVTNGALFGFGHIMFNNWLAVIGTFAVGCLIAYRYDRTRSFWAAWFEHTLYGWLVFTVGLGRYFFTGVSNFN
jgi:hypothetical protein